MAGCPTWPFKGSKTKRLFKENIKQVCILAYSAVEGIKSAHQQGRALTYRATAVEEATSQQFVTHSDITTYYRDYRQRLPAPHGELTKEQ